jgi:predicted RNase H-like HicB family nuclease
MPYYAALMFAAGDGYDFIAPDVPGFTAHAATEDLDRAAATARQVLTSHLSLLLDHGGELPKPRSLKALRSDPDFAEDFDEAEAVILLPALLPGGRTRRINISLDENTLDLIDRSAADRNLTRSAFIAEAARRMAAA